MTGKNAAPDGPITIKKYANRRLYNTATSSYVTLDHLCEMVKRGEEFNVYDAKSNEDITRSVLTQIIFEEENKGQNLLPIQFLRQLIGFYGNQMGAAVPRYLELSMETFARNQEQVRARMADTLGGQPFKVFEDMARQNMVMFQETWLEAYRRMLTFGTPQKPGSRDMGAAMGRDADMGRPDCGVAPAPSHYAATSAYNGGTNGQTPANGPASGNGPGEASPVRDELSLLRDQIEAMQRRLDQIGLPSPAPQSQSQSQPQSQSQSGPQAAPQPGPGSDPAGGSGNGHHPHVLEKSEQPLQPARFGAIEPKVGYGGTATQANSEPGDAAPRGNGLAGHRDRPGHNGASQSVGEENTRRAGPWNTPESQRESPREIRPEIRSGQDNPSASRSEDSINDGLTPEGSGGPDKRH